MTTGERLYHRRYENNWSLREASERIGIHKSTLWRYEMDMVKRIDPGIMERIQSIYHIDCAEESEESMVAVGEYQGMRESMNAEDQGTGEEMTEEEILRRYRQLDLRSRRRIQRFLESTGDAG